MHKVETAIVLRLSKFKYDKRNLKTPPAPEFLPEDLDVVSLLLKMKIEEKA